MGRLEISCVGPAIAYHEIRDYWLGKIAPDLCSVA